MVRHGIRIAISVAGLAVLLALTACAASHREYGKGEPPRLATNAPDEVWRAFREAEALVDRGKRMEALRRLEPIVAERPLFVPTARLRQILMREIGRAGQLWAEVEDLQRRYPDRPEPAYLAARLMPKLVERYEYIEQCARRWPGSWWIQYADNWRRSRVGQGKKNQHERLMPLAHAAMPWPGGAILVEQLFSGKVPTSKFLAIFQRYAEEFPDYTRLRFARYGAGEVWWEHARVALREAPFSIHVAGMLARVAKLPQQRRQLAALCRREPSILDRLILAGHGEALMKILQAADAPALAAHARDTMLARGLVQGVGRERRWVFGPRTDKIQELVGRGDLEGAIAIFEDSVPPILLHDASNRLAPRIGALLRGPCRGVRSCPRDLADARRILRVLLDAGWVEESVTLGSSWQKTHPGLADLVSEGLRFTRFELALIERTTSFGEKRVLEDFVEDLREASVEIFGEDLVGTPRILSFPLIGGKIVDPFGPGLPRLMDRYGRHLIFGTLNEPVRSPALAVGRKLFERRLPVHPGLWVPGRAREVVVDDMRFTSAMEVGFSEPAGVALWNHYVIDLRKWDEWVDDLYRRWLRIEESGVEALLTDPVPSAGPLSIARPAQVPWKLLARAMRDTNWTREDLRGEVLRLLRLHEHAHLVDAQRFLPAMQKIGPAVWLFAQSGFSAQTLMADLEGRAEIAALALGADPRITLGHLANFISEPYAPSNSPHALGFTRMLRRLLQRWHEDGAPGADASRNLFAQLHLLAPDRARAYAREILAELDF